MTDVRRTPVWGWLLLGSLRLQRWTRPALALAPVLAVQAGLDSKVWLDLLNIDGLLQSV